MKTMMKFLVVILSVFIYDQSNASSLNSLKSSDLLEILKHSKVPLHFNVDAVNRAKRQISSHTEYCVQRCLSNFETMLENAGLTVPNSQLFPVDRTLFQNNNFQQYCTSTKKYTDCIDSCGYFTGKDIIMDAFKILDFLCVDHYDEFIQYLPCYQNADKSVENVCDTKCGDSDYYSGIAKDTSASAKTKIGKICGVVSCSAECAATQYTKVCKEKGAAKLILSFTKYAMKKTVEIFENLGIGEHIPGKCYAMSGNGASKLNFIILSLLLPLLMI